MPIKVSKDYWKEYVESRGFLGPLTYASQEQEEESASSSPLMETPKEEMSSADRDLLLFAQRVGDKLIPNINDYEPKIKAQLTEVRNGYVRELLGVFEGKETMEKWFQRTKSNRGLHQLDLMQMLYGSLEGLQSQEARDMKKQYAEALQGMSQAYRPP